MDFNLQLLLSSVLVCMTFCSYSDPNLYTEHLPASAEMKSIEVNIEFNPDFYTTVFIYCKNYDALQFFEIRQEHFENFATNKAIRIEFFNCFNNATDNENYNLMTSLANLINFKTTKNWNQLRITLNESAIVNSDMFFNNFKFQNFEDVSIHKLGFKSTEFLNLLDCYVCTFQNNNLIDFNDFNNNLNTIELDTEFNKLLNFNKVNLKKFNSIRRLKITYFDLDDYNTFNVPELFEFNSELNELTIEDSGKKITLHEKVFAGLIHLNSLALQDLQLDYIHKDLFKDLTMLKSLYLSSNNIKRIEPTSFENNRWLTFVTITDNPFFTEPQEEINEFKLGDSIVELFLANFTIHTLNVFEHLVKNQKVRRVLFQSILIDPIDLNEFTKFRTDRETPINIKILGEDITLGLGYVKSVGINIKSENQLKFEQLSAIIKLPISDASFCTDCAVLKQIFPFYLNNYREQPGFYFAENRVLVIPNSQESCRHLEHYFEETFVENCPVNCNCIYNPLLDKIKILCNNKNLTEIPIIPYPMQFTKVHSIELHFENNSLSKLSFTNQDPKVLKKLSTLLFQNNAIELVATDDEQSNYIQVLDICNNPIVSGNNIVKINGIVTDNDEFNEYFCRYGSIYPNPPEYIQQEKAGELEGLLNGLKCN